MAFSPNKKIKLGNDEKKKYNSDDETSDDDRNGIFEKNIPVKRKPVCLLFKKSNMLVLDEESSDENACSSSDINQKSASLDVGTKLNDLITQSVFYQRFIEENQNVDDTMKCFLQRLEENYHIPSDEQDFLFNTAHDLSRNFSLSVWRTRNHFKKGEWSLFYRALGYIGNNGEKRPKHHRGITKRRTLESIDY